MKYIEKIAESLAKGLILNKKSDSTQDTYSCDYINNLSTEGGGDSTPVGAIFDYEGTEVPDGYEQILNTDLIGPVDLVLTDANTTSVGVFGVDENTANIPISSEGKILCLLPSPKNSGYVAQILFYPYRKNIYYRYRMWYNGSWQWVNWLQFSGAWITDQDLEPYNVFSTTERKIGQWINGKPLYRRTLELTPNMKGATERWKKMRLDLENIDIIMIDNPHSYIIDVEGSASVVPVPFNSPDGYNQNFYFSRTNGLVDLVISIDELTNIYKIYLTVSYTKTTD